MTDPTKPTPPPAGPEGTFATEDGGAAPAHGTQ